MRFLAIIMAFLVAIFSPTCAVTIHNFRTGTCKAIGAICARRGGRDCGVIQKAGHGLSLCLGNANSHGSYWFGIPSGHKTDLDESPVNLEYMNEAHNVTGTVTPDIISIEDHQFRIGGSTPQKVTDGLIEYFLTADGTYADLPEEFKSYELAERVDDE
ncbi:unnamed protein product [Penicillium glandicola]